MQYGLSVELADIGYVEMCARGTDLHTVKSKAGKAFHADNVNRVCVFDETGKAHLYLKKTPTGVYREER